MSAHLDGNFYLGALIVICALLLPACVAYLWSRRDD